MTIGSVIDLWQKELGKLAAKAGKERFSKALDELRRLDGPSESQGHLQFDDPGKPRRGREK